MYIQDVHDLRSSIKCKNINDHTKSYKHTKCTNVKKVENCVNCVNCVAYLLSTASKR